MSDLTFSIEIARSPEDVFAFLLDPSRAPEWTSGLIAREFVTPPPVRVGSRWKETRKVAGMTHAVEIEVTLHEPPGEGRTPPYRHGGRGEAMGVEARFEAVVEAAGEGLSRVSLSADVVGRSMFTRPLAAKLRRAAEDEGDRPLQRLKAVLESGERT